MLSNLDLCTLVPFIASNPGLSRQERPAVKSWPPIKQVKDMRGELPPPKKSKLRNPPNRVSNSKRRFPKPSSSELPPSPGMKMG